MSEPPVLDTVRTIATPEGCELELRIAGPITRVRAWFYDFLLRLVGWLGLAMAAGATGRLGMGFLLVGGFLLEWFYPILFEVYMEGQTPGKRACDLVVVHDDGRPVGWNGAFIRNTVRFVDFLPLLYAAGFIASLLNAEGKRLGDLAAGTVVAHAGGRRPESQSPAGIQEKGAEPPPLPLTMEEQQAIIEYHRRAGQLTDERALELAVLPEPLTVGLSPEQARRRLLRIGNFLLGQR
ncbi:MAG: domain containing protein [Rhodocyclaceae bacterium]|nr:domain containing protein [Rhodocyclaceae bacterium]